MAWVVDSCVILDVALKDELYGLTSATCLDYCQSDGLVVCPISIIEIAPAFGGAIENVREFLAIIGAEPYSNWLETDTQESAKAWSRYVTAKRQGLAPKRPIADILIGAFACRHQGLITRNSSNFSPYFPGLAIIKAESFTTK